MSHYFPTPYWGDHIPFKSYDELVDCYRRILSKHMSDMDIRLSYYRTCRGLGRDENEFYNENLSSEEEIEYILNNLLENVDYTIE